jgi:hypothetical protein
MAYTIDQPTLGTAAVESGYGDTSMTYTTSVSASAGTWLIAFLGWVFSDTLNSFTDAGPGLTWTRFQVRPNPADDPRLAFAVAWSASAFTQPIAVTSGWNSGDVGNKFCQIASIAGGTSGDTLSALTPNFGSSTTWSINYTTSVNDEIVFAVNYAASGGVSGATGGTNELFDTLSSGSQISGNYETKAIAGSDSLNGTLSFSDTWLTYGIRLIPAGAPAGPNPIVPRQAVESRPMFGPF